MKLFKIVRFMFTKPIYQKGDIVLYPFKRRDLWSVYDIKRDWQNLSFVYNLKDLDNPIHEYILVFYNQILDGHFFSELEHHKDA